MVVYGDVAILAHGAELLGLDVDLDVVGRDAVAARRPRRARRGRRRRCLPPPTTYPGCSTGEPGAAAREYVVQATEDARAGRTAGIVTMPMNKEATQLYRPGFVGHTEMIAELCGVQRVTMMLTAALADGSSLAVTHVSTHCSLREAIERVQPRRVLDVIELTDATLRRFLATPRIAVCGLNPHAGEHGLFGVEDIERITPAIEEARARPASTPAGPTRPTPCSTRPSTATATTRSCACTTTRATGR